MQFIEFYKEQNESVEQRYELVMERIASISGENSVKAEFKEYFVHMAEYIGKIEKLCELTKTGRFRELSTEELKEINESLHREIREEYEKSYFNPTYMFEKIGEEYGKYLLWLAVSIRNLIEPALSAKFEIVVIYAELFAQIYNLFEMDDISEKNVKETVYWFIHDNMDITVDINVREMFDTDRDFAKSIITESDLTDEKYLYFYGDHISLNEIKTSRLLASFSQEKIDAMAKTYTDGFINGFKILNKDLSKKESVEIVYNIGFERVVKAAIKQFEEQGLKALIRARDYSSTPANRQYGYDHRYMDAPIFDKCIKDRKTDVERVVYEKYKDKASKMAGPAVIEVFGEKPFSPENKEKLLKYNDKQIKLMRDYNNEHTQIHTSYVLPEERSFTIIAYPVADIGENYEEIFEETIKINNLDQDLYRKIQSTIIDTLDKGEYVEILGMNGNKTNLLVALNELKNPEKETLFENCLADVNIPLGEVFTSPKLEGTNGILHVTKVFLNELNYKELTLEFKDGCVDKYTCANFEDEEANKKYIKENLLKNHDTLPMGEFAIGTNTTAYAVGTKYDIIPRMPILIVEKMGPHFAVGDTCYGYEEDEKTYNPDGKEIVAKSNSISDLRKTEPEKAYYHCHTDITIPYNELGEINVITRDKTKICILKEGRFVLPGTEKLNEALEFTK